MLCRCRSVECRTEWHSTWLDNSKAKFKLGWRPSYDLAKLIDSTWDYKRAAGDERVGCHVHMLQQPLQYFSVPPPRVVQVIYYPG